MRVIQARNVNDAYRRGLRLMAQDGDHQESRNGPVLRVPGIVATEYRQPTERVLFDAKRNANPFFHLFEALWMLNGQNDVATMEPFLSTFKQFSDDGFIFHGAYGHRWRHWPKHHGHEFDQLDAVIRLLEHDPTSRRAVIGMWDPFRDLGITSKDLPCNDLITCGIREGKLDISVMCRSNDIIYGCYGANAVHMSILHEYLAAMIGVPVGIYTQISFDYHAYVETPYRWEDYWPLAVDALMDWPDDDVIWQNPYRSSMVCPLVTAPKVFDRELHDIMHALRAHHSLVGLDPMTFANTFFRNVVFPMHRAFRAYKDGHFDDAIAALVVFGENDWCAAGTRWIVRRKLSAARRLERHATSR